tara:strand:- start:92 stop:616 length:525 start_codon:yes stop_codon:yes gene_type:complete
MGFFGNTSGVNERYSKYKSSADMIMQLTKDHADNLDRNFEETMASGIPSVQSLRLSSFLAGFVGIAVENKEFPQMAGWASGGRLKELSNVIQDTIVENTYLPWDLDYHFFHINDKKSHPHVKINLSFYQGGVIVANRLKMNDDVNALFNLTIFLDTLESADGHYVDGVSNKSPF